MDRATQDYQHRVTAARLFPGVIRVPTPPKAMTRSVPPRTLEAPAPPADAVTVEARAKLAADGREHWLKLHTLEELTPETFAAWRAEIPAFGCHCVAHFEAVLSRLPPVYGKAIATRRRGWEWHQAINELLAKAGIEFSEACDLYRWH